MVIPLDSYLKKDRSNFEINVLLSQTFCCTKPSGKSGDEFGLVTELLRTSVFHLSLLSHVIADQPLEFRCKLGVEVSLDQICHSYS